MVQKAYISNSNAFVNVEGLQGELAVIVEISNRIEQRLDTWLPQSFFYRCCKRHGVSVMRTRESLQKKGIIQYQGSWPAKITMSVLVYKSYAEWRMMGKQVAKGQTSHARCFNYETPLFCGLQLVKKTNGA